MVSSALMTKVCVEPSWDNAVTYGAETDVPALSGAFVLGGDGKNIMVETYGLYWVDVQYDEAAGALTTYNLTPLTTVGVVGSFAASNWGTDVEMTTADGGITYTAEVSFAANDAWKVRFNSDWGYNLGAEPGNAKHAVRDGDDYKVETAGTYIITLTTQPGIPTITCVAK